MATENTHAIKFAGIYGTPNVPHLYSLNWRGEFPHYIAEKGSGGFSFAFGLYPEVHQANEAYTIIIALHGTTVDNRRWFYEVEIPLTNAGRFPYKFSLADGPFNREYMTIDPGLWVTRPELIQDYIDGQYDPKGFMQFVPHVTYAATDSHGQLTEHHINAMLNSKELFTKPGEPARTEILQNRIRAPLFSYTNGTTTTTYPGWMFIAGHLSDDGNGFISVNGEKTYFSYGDAEIDVASLHQEDKILSWKNAFMRLAPGTINAKIVAKPCTDPRFVNGFAESDLMAFWMTNLWVGLTHFHGFEQQWIERLYDKTTGRTLDAGDGSMTFEGPRTIRPVLYINPKASDNGRFYNRVDGQRCTALPNTTSAAFVSLNQYPIPGKGSTSIYECKPDGHPEVKRGECIIQPNERFTTDPARDDAYYAYANDPAIHTMRRRTIQSILPLPPANSYGKFYMAIVINRRCDFMLYLVNCIDAAGRDDGKQIGGMMEVSIKGETAGFRLDVSYVFDQGDPNENQIMYRTAETVLIPVSSAENRMHLIHFWFNAANIASISGETHVGGPSFSAACATNNATPVTCNMSGVTIDNVMFPHYNGTSAAISLNETTAPPTEGQVYWGTTYMGGLWLYSQDIIMAHPEIPWDLSKESSDSQMRGNFIGYVDPIGYIFKDTGAQGDETAGILKGIRPSLYIDPSVGPHCNAAYNAMQIGDAITPSYYASYGGFMDPAPLCIHTACGSIKLKHIAGLTHTTVISHQLEDQLA